MGIRNDISCAVAHMVVSMDKEAQAPGFIPTPSYYASMLPGEMRERTLEEWGLPQSGKPNLATALNSLNAHNLRGAVRGAGKEAIPGIIDFVGGGMAGIANGLAELAFGPTGSFNNGFKQGRGNWRNWVTDPMRESLGWVGRKSGIAGALDKLVDSSDKMNGGAAEGAELAEGIGEIGGDLAASWPMFGKAVQAMFKVPGALGKGLSTIPKVGPVASKIPSTAVGYQTMGGPEAVDAVKRGWQWFTGRGYDANPQLAEYRDQNINKAKDLARWYIDNGRQQEFDDLMSNKELWGQLPEKDRNDLIGSAVARFNGGRSQ